MAAHAAKVEDKNLVTDSTVSITLVDAQTLKAQQKRLGRAATLQKFEKLVDTMTEVAADPKGASNLHASDSPDDGSPEAGIESYLKDGIPTELLKIGIPVSELLEMLKNNTQLANESYKLFGETALAQGGITKADDGTYTIGESLANTEADCVIAAGASDAQSIRSDAIGGFAEAAVALGSELTGLARKGSTQEEEDNVTKAENAIKFEQSIPEGTVSLNDREQLETTNPAKAADMRAAISRLAGGSHDVTKDECAFGSREQNQQKTLVRKARTVYLEDLREDRGVDVGADPATGGRRTVSAREAIEHASTTERADIRKTLEKRLSTAKEELRSRVKKVQEEKAKYLQIGSTLGQAAGKGLNLGKSTQTQLSAQHNAEKTLIQSQLNSMQGIGQAQIKGIDAAKASGKTTLDLLAQLMGQLGKRG